MSETRDAFIAAITNEGDEIFLTLVEAPDQGGPAVAERWALTEVRARKLLRELFERLH